MTEFMQATGGALRAGAIPVLRDYASLHEAVQRLVELDQTARSIVAQPRETTEATAVELQETWRHLNDRFFAAFAELTRLDADLATRRRAVLDTARAAMRRAASDAMAG